MGALVSSDFVVGARLIQRRENRSSADRKASWRAGAGSRSPGLPDCPSYKKEDADLELEASLQRSSGAQSNTLIFFSQRN